MPVLRPGEVVQSESGGGRWQVERKIGEGQFSEVYSVVEQSTQQQRALKIEKRTDVRTVRQEYKVLKRLQAGCRQSVRVHEGGEYAGGRFFMVMDLLGPNLTTVRRGALGGALELTAAKVVAASMLKALEQVHSEGHIHRDVKPANFVMDPADAVDPAAAAWTLVDFGLARRYVDETSRQPLPPRPEAAFRGSTTYASVNCHRLEDQGRRDDLWGWFYCLVELIEGTLPWRTDREAAAPAPTNTATPGGGGTDSQLAVLPSPPGDASQAAAAWAQQQAAGAGGGGGGGGGPGLTKEQVLQRKLECLEQPELLVSSLPCPQAIVDLSNYLRALGFEDAPNHQYLRSLLGKLDGLAAAPPGRPQLAGTMPAATQPPNTAEAAPGGPAGGRGGVAPSMLAPANGRHQGAATPASSRPASRAGSPRGGATAGIDRRPSRLGRQEEAQQTAQQQAPARPAPGGEQRAGQKEGHRQHEQGAVPPLSKQHSRDRSRERDRDDRGRRQRSKSRSHDRSASSRSYSRSSSRSSRSRSWSRSRSRSRGGDRGRRSRGSSSSRSRERGRDRRGREPSRERRRSRSRDRDSRRSRSRSRARERDHERERERARERQRGNERTWGRRRASRSRSYDRRAGRAEGSGAAAPPRRRSRSRSPHAGSIRAQLRRNSGSNAKEVVPPSAAAAPATAAGQAPAEGGGVAPTELAAVAQYTTDTHAKYRAGLELVFALRQGALSEAGAAACRQLRGLEPAEAAGVVCWLLDELATGAEQRHLPAVGAFCEEVAAFALGTAKRCSERSRQR